jgi:hypothetical protein
VGGGSGTILERRAADYVAGESHLMNVGGVGDRMAGGARRFMRWSGRVLALRIVCRVAHAEVGFLYPENRVESRGY